MKVPDGWRVATLGEVATLVRGVTYKRTDAYSSPEEGLIPLLRATNITTNLNLTSDLVYIPADLVKPDQKLQQKDVLLASSSGSLSVVGKSAMLTSPWEGTFGAFCAVLRATGVSPSYLAHYVQSEEVRRVWRQAAKGTNINNLKVGTLKDTPIAFPTLYEQHRIVERIEELFTHLDAAEAGLEKAEKRLEGLRATSFTSALAGRGTTRALTEVASVANGQTPRGLSDIAVPSSTNDALPFFKVGDMNDGDGRLLANSRTYLPRTEAAGLKLHLRPRGTVVIPKRGGAIATNKKRILGVEGYYDLNTMGLVPNADLDPNYLWHWLQTVDLAQLADGSNVPQINAPQISGLRIPWLPVEDQRKIVLQCDASFDAINRTSESLKTAKKRSAALRRSILAAAFEGRLV